MALRCEKTPIRFPESGVSLKDIPENKTCKLRLVAKQAGPGKLMDAGFGFIVDETTTASLYYNGVQYDIKQTHFVVNNADTTATGTIRLPGYSVGNAEMYIYFESRTTKDTICLVVVLQKSSKDGHPYFTTLGLIDRNKQSLATLFTTNTPLMEYRGVDLRERGTQKSPKCPEKMGTVRYIVSTVPVKIDESAFSRILRLLNAGKSGYPYTSGNGLPVAASEITTSDASSAFTRISGILLDGVSTPTESDGKLLKQMQCRRLDVQKDVKDGKVYIGGKKRAGDTTLAQELEAAADPTKNLTGAPSQSIQPGDIETVVAIVIGVLVSLVIIAVIVYYLWSVTQRKGKEVIGAGIAIAAAAAAGKTGSSGNSGNSGNSAAQSVANSLSSLPSLKSLTAPKQPINKPLSQIAYEIFSRLTEDKSLQEGSNYAKLREKLKALPKPQTLDSDLPSYTLNDLLYTLFKSNDPTAPPVSPTGSPAGSPATK
jgi:hypothetical protein